MTLVFLPVKDPTKVGEGTEGINVTGSRTTKCVDFRIYLSYKTNSSVGRLYHTDVISSISYCTG